jgi:hypothetical protein
VTALRDVLGADAMRPPTFDFHGVTEDHDAFRRTAEAFDDKLTSGRLALATRHGPSMGESR